MNNNEFKFSLHQENILLCECIFSADKFNPFTRYSIDIRGILPSAITKLQKTLSKKFYTTYYNEYELLEYYQKIINLYPQRYRSDMRYNPQPIIQHIEEKIIKGVECKIGFYINDKTIVERLFYVDGFNPIARFSTDLTDAVIDITGIIRSQIISSDEKNMWDDYDLINIKGLSINQIRELSFTKREEMLRRLKH